jgi:hypothetical protein
LFGVALVLPDPRSAIDFIQPLRGAGQRQVDIQTAKPMRWHRPI